MDSLGYTISFSGSGATTLVELSWKRKEIEIAQKKILQKVLDGNDLKMGWWRTCNDVLLLKLQDV